MLQWPGTFFLIAMRSSNHDIKVFFFSTQSKNFVIIGKIIWFWSTFNKESSVNFASMGVTGCWNFLKFGIKIVKSKLFGSVQQILLHFLNFSHQKCFFLCVLEKIFPLNDIFWIQGFRFKSYILIEQNPPNF